MITIKSELCALRDMVVRAAVFVGMICFTVVR
jgi:hypothetical protein